MNDDRKPGSGDAGEDAGDGLDAWLAAHFPPPPSEPAAGSEPDVPAAPPEPPAPEPPATEPPSPEPPASEPPAPEPAAPPATEPPAPTAAEPPTSAPPATQPPPLEPPPAPEAPTEALWPPVALPPASEPPPPNAPASVSFGELPPEHSAPPPMTEELEGIPAAAEFPPPPTEAFADVSGASGIDDLFGETKFLEYEEGPAASENPFVRRPVAESAPEESEPQTPEGGKKWHTVLLWIAGSLVAVLALVALFLLGTKLPAILGPAPGALVTPTATPTPTPTPTVALLGPVEPGVYLWDELLGGECVDPYVGPWEIEYTVVDCEDPHPAQLVTRGTFAALDGETAYPGLEALQSQVNLLCTAPAVVDYAKANAYTDIQFEASYALSEQDWFDGNRSYYCFLSRSADGELTGTIAMPQVAPPAESEKPAP